MSLDLSLDWWDRESRTINLNRISLDELAAEVEWWAEALRRYPGHWRCPRDCGCLFVGGRRSL